MSWKPILFNTEMVRAVLDSRKTQTRRVMKLAKRGDSLWVRETFAPDIPGCPDGITYRADHQDPRGDGPANPIKWKPSIFMPRWASRISLKVLDVRVERVQDISEDDADAEVFGGQFPHVVMPDMFSPDDCHLSIPECFARLWDSINAKRGFPWASNPWVWVVEFEIQNDT